ncbi:hypothetical protein [Nocardia implantans]|uniref:IrrE N-terminal-like domain-containing protein n=1 Tax=Nocardia implantans TaxID=3108168 RepID=A0ABU6ATW1_9NOCA|nr:MULTISPECIES: hypothetical protein [unclassified Nocardia]MBF6191195.1 hypothetical protein [Nocardia beijingensis]MEA3529194.1 hypothetical protein [Nocardia sp. CDC192]MEB3510859.1 hypothetical protein [Nocardia sp. CDC186]
MTSMEARFGDAARTVPLPNPWNLTAYLAAVAAHRGRSISLHPVPKAMLADTGCGGGGLWVARKHDDIIVYDAAATGRNADHVILHEVGHMLLGHDKDRERGNPVPPSLAVILPSISPRSIEHVLGRADFGVDREREAEVFADMTMVYSTLPRRRRRSFRLFGRGR